VTIPEKLVPHFKPGKALREGVDASLPVDPPAAEPGTS
jgi:integration host factor subunit beta